MSIRAQAIAEFLGADLMGPDLDVMQVGTLDAPQPNTLIFAKRYDPAFAERLNAASPVLALVLPEYAGQLEISHILTTNPRREFARVVEQYFSKRYPPGIAPTAIIAPTAQIGEQVHIGHYCVIGENVEIGAHTVLLNHVIINDNCVIGPNCLIKSHTVIGEKGFGYDFEDDGTPVAVPHSGRVIIGAEVHIGALVSINQGTIGDTVIADRAKIDDHVFIAHNAQIGENTLVIAGAEISGRVQVGKNVWIGPQVCIINGITVGDDALLGMGAVVNKPVEPNTVNVGNPARVLRPRHNRS
ncbi:MAG: transferase [Chloroflexi bacterium]|nr:transferase [Chloroflexota bacterium]